MHMCYERPGLVTALNGSSGFVNSYQKDPWPGQNDHDRQQTREGRSRNNPENCDRVGRDPNKDLDPNKKIDPKQEREQKRKRDRQSRAHPMPAEKDPTSTLFTAPTKLTGTNDRVSQQIQTKLGDYNLAQTLFDDPSKSIGICAEPPSPAPCPPSRRETEFKKPAHAPQNGRLHYRHHPYGKSDVPASAGAPSHRPPPLRPINGYVPQNTDSSQPNENPIKSILKEMQDLPAPLTLIAATPRNETESDDLKFVYNNVNKKVQESRQFSNDAKDPKPRLDNRIANSRSSVSPDVVNKDLGLSESDDEVPATNARLEPILSPIGSGDSPSSGSESSPSDSETESSSAESSGVTAPPPAPAPPPERNSWSLSNFAPPAAHPPEELRHALADVKGKPSPISELSDSEASSPSPGAVRRRRSIAKHTSAASSDEEPPRQIITTQSRVPPAAPVAVKRGRPPKARNSEERPPKKKRGRPKKLRTASPRASPVPSPRVEPDSDAEPDPPQHNHLQDTKTHIFRKVFTPKKVDECGGKGGKGGKGKGGKGKGQVTIIEVTAPESGADDDDRRHRDRSVERRNEEAIARVSPPQQPENLTRRREADRISNERIQERVSIERTDHRRSDDRIDRPIDRPNDRIPSDRLSADDRSERRSSERTEKCIDKIQDRLSSEKMSFDRHPEKQSIERHPEKLSIDRHPEKLSIERHPEKMSIDRIPNDKSIERLSSEKMSIDRLTGEKIDRMSLDRLSGDKMSIERISNDKMSVDRMDRITHERFVRAEADVGSGLKSGRGSERLEEASSVVSERRARARVLVQIPLSRLNADTVRSLRTPRRPPIKRPVTPPPEQSGEVAATNHERSAGQTPIYYSYFERLPADALSDEERDHKYYLAEAKRLRHAAEREQLPLPRVMLYLESVLCFVLTGRVLELELDTKKAFNIYRETIEYIKSIHSMPQRYRASPHATFSKLDILSLRVQALLYLRMFKMYNREVKEYYKIVQEYQQKPACAESVSPLSPTPSPGGSVGSVGSGASASSGYCSLAHSVPAHAHHALLQLTKYYTFLYVAHDLWEQADCLCRLRSNQDLFIAVDRKCGPLTLFSTFRHLVQYVRYAISLLKNAPRE